MEAISYLIWTDIMDRVRQIAPLDTTVFLTGETGTGKTQLARLIHFLSGHRDEPFLIVDCGAQSANLIESEIFGHRKGAIAGAASDRVGKFGSVGSGTVLLEEVDSLSPHLQSKLLRALDERIYEPLGSNKSYFIQARIIATVNGPLEQTVRSGKFSSDLYDRLSEVGFSLDPLRARPGLIKLLANQLLAECAQRNIAGITPEAMEILLQHDWPGNIRELRNTIERAVLRARGPAIQRSDLAWLCPVGALASAFSHHRNGTGKGPRWGRVGLAGGAGAALAEG